MTLISLIPYDGIEPMELEELLAVDIIILSIWFVIALCISLIVNNEKKKQIKVNDIEEKQCESKCETRTNFEKIEIKKENNQKCLYTCESGIDAHEYKRLTKYFPQIYWVYITRCTIVNIIIFLVVSVAVNSVFVSVIYLLISQAILMIYYKVRLECIAFNDFNKSYEKEHFDTVFHIEFFNDYFIRHGDTISQKVDYSSINKCVEADTRFYLKNKISNKIFIIKKDECDTNLINFIREKFESTEYYIKDINGHKNYKKNKKIDPSSINKAMFNLFMLTIFSIFGALYVIKLIYNVSFDDFFDFIKNMWIFWCFLPIPILSIGLGFKCTKAGFKCIKNIVIGFIVSFILIVLGAFCVIPDFSYNYNKIDKYRDIIDVKLPDSGILEAIKSDFSTMIDVQYNNKNAAYLERSIESSNNWILSTEISSPLKIFIPFIFQPDNNTYYSIYNETTKEYNKLPENSGKYKIYAMEYDMKSHRLGIYEYNYSYK